MPIYTYKNPDKEEYVDVVQRMNDRHVFVDDAGQEWQRVWTAPTTSIGLNSDVDSSRQFVDKTGDWSVGDMWDYSKELSEKRKSKRGDDHVEKAYNKKKSQERHRKRNLQNKIEAHRHKKSSQKK